MSKYKLSNYKSLAEVHINYLFFGFYFICIAFIHAYHVNLIEPAPSFSRYFFLVYTLGQCVIETLVLVYAAHLCKVLFGARGLYTFSIGVFFLLLARVVDFPLVRFMDMSVWYALSFITQESPENFVEILYASNVSLVKWMMAASFGAGVLLSAIFLFKMSERFTARKPVSASPLMLTLSLAASGLMLLSWDFSTKQHLDPSRFDLYQKTLPWKDTLFNPEQQVLALAEPLKPKQFQIPLKPESLPQPGLRPDVYLFVVESLREDFITASNAPHLQRFKQENVHFDLALSNANATHISWFSLFYSQYPFYWGCAAHNSPKNGSLALQLMKQLGYDIYVYSSARLAYYQMADLLFGENAYLAKEIHVFEEGEPWQRDQQAIHALISQIDSSQPPGGRLFITFLDSTHLDYSWPKEDTTPFEPVDETINYLTAALSNEGVEKIKNRYRNALHYVDSLFGKFFKALDASKGGQDAVLVVTSDHGEEFYEQGRLFHASRLSHFQTHVPLYYKFGRSDLEKLNYDSSMSCHMDIFPSIVHYLTGEDLALDHLQGQSIFRQERWPFTVIGRYNASRSPCEFCIHNGSEKVIAAFSNPGDVHQAKALKVLCTKDLSDRMTFRDDDYLSEKFGPALERIFTP